MWPDFAKCKKDCKDHFWHFQPEICTDVLYTRIFFFESPLNKNGHVFRISYRDPIRECIYYNKLHVVKISIVICLHCKNILNLQLQCSTGWFENVSESNHNGQINNNHFIFFCSMLWFCHHNAPCCFTIIHVSFKLPPVVSKPLVSTVQFYTYDLFGSAEMLSKVRPRLVASKNTQLNQYQIEFELYAWIGLQLQINMQKRIVFCFVCPFNPNNLAFFRC